MPEKSLYGRLGGIYAIAGVVLKFLRTLWSASVAGGPFEYSGKALRDAHAGLRINRRRG